MEVKVFRDVSSREKTYAGLTFKQVISVLSIILVIIFDIVNSIFWNIPSFITKPLGFIIIALCCANALYRPHGMDFGSWLKLYFKFNTTIQVRKMEIEKSKRISDNDFKKAKEIKESEF